MTLNYKRMLITALADLSYATGVLDGLGHTNTYLNEQVAGMLEAITSTQPPAQSERREER